MFKKTLSELSVSDIKAPTNLVVIDSTESFVSAFSKLVASNILSAPVYDAKMKKFIGYLEVRDLLSIVIAVTKKKILLLYFFRLVVVFAKESFCSQKNLEILLFLVLFLVFFNHCY